MTIKTIKSKIDNMNEYYSFMESRIGNLFLSKSNCFGTGLFCAGEIETDEYLIGKEPKDILNGLSKAKDVQKGMLVAWRETYPYALDHYKHLGLVTHIDPVLVTHRIGANCPVDYDKPLEEIDERYQSYHSMMGSEIHVEFFIPKKLEAAL